MLALVLDASVAALAACAPGLSAAEARGAPYPRSPLLAGVTWHPETYRQGGAGGDLWPVTTAADRRVLTAWGDGVVGCRRKVSYGTAVLPVSPAAAPRASGCGPAGEGKGKILSLLAAGGALAVWRSGDLGRTWDRPAWRFAADGEPRPLTFVNFGPGYAGARDGYVYMASVRSDAPGRRAAGLMRAPAARLGERDAYQYFAGRDGGGQPVWAGDARGARPVFEDGNGVDGLEITYDAGLGRYLLTASHGGGGRIGVFEAPEPWGPWSTVAYEDRWLGVRGGEFLGLRFPTGWMADRGRELWAVFSCYGRGCGHYHDRLNLMRATLQPR